MAPRPLGIDAAAEAERITMFIGDVVGTASANGVVVGLSGGIDSSVVGALCVRALGKKKVLALLMPSDHTPRKDLEDARAMADSWGVKAVKVPITSTVEGIIASAGTEGTKIARANLEARTRMMILYFHANTLGYLVAGTGDRSESLLGYFTKWGDGGVDLLPIAHLYKTQVRALGAYLGVPKTVVEKPASPQLWPGQKASDEIPAEYDKLDVALRCIFDLKAKPAAAALEAGVSLEVVEKVLEMHRKTAHKRAMPPSPA